MSKINVRYDSSSRDGIEFGTVVCFQYSFFQTSQGAPGMFGFFWCLLWFFLMGSATVVSVLLSYSFILQFSYRSILQLFPIVLFPIVCFLQFLLSVLYFQFCTFIFCFHIFLSECSFRLFFQFILSDFSFSFSFSFILSDFYF